ncbi:MAG: hypothetical protein RH949_02435 [Coleofasciculus sp. A1-SPW-01]|uniref:hypothetical protein n=1 Tax=Coleofasciculus sp. A1-SPW-01 TaxID=3070819 RepID=UPI0005C5F447
MPPVMDKTHLNKKVIAKIKIFKEFGYRDRPLERPVEEGTTGIIVDFGFSSGNPYVKWETGQEGFVSDYWIALVS